MSFSPSTGNISVVKEIVDKLLKGYDVRLRPDFGGNSEGRAGCWGRACSGSGLGPDCRESSPHTSPALTSSLTFPSPLLLSLLLSFHRLCTQLGCPHCDVSGGVLPQQRHSAFPLLQAFFHHRQQVIPPPFLFPMPDILALFPAEGPGDCWWGCWLVLQSCSLSSSEG